MNDDNTTGKTGDFNAKVDKLAEDARAAGNKFVETDAGRKVADAANTALDKAEEFGRKALDSDMAKKALDTEFGRQASGFAQEVTDKTRSAIPNDLARSVAVGAAAGAVVAIPIPFIGSILGALIGGGLGYLRAVTKKS